MLSYFKIILYTILVLNIVSSCTVKKPYIEDWENQKEFSTIKNKEEYIANIFTGYFSNEEQALLKKSPLYSNQRFVGRRIWTERVREYWVASYRFRPEVPEKPVAQVIFHIKRLNRDTTLLTTYGYKDKTKYALAWQEETPFADLTPKDLVHKEGCKSYIFTSDRKTYHMIGDDLLCPLNLSPMMAFVKLEGTLTPDKISYLTSFYNKGKNFTVGFNKDALVFKRIAIKSIPKY